LPVIAEHTGVTELLKSACARGKTQQPTSVDANRAKLIAQNGVFSLPSPFSGHLGVN
jgi:hypothetical protein